MVSYFRTIVRLAPRHQLFAALCVIATLISWSPLKALLAYSLRDERYTYLLIAPLISAAFLYLEKGRIFRDSRYSPAVGIPLLLLGLVTCFGSRMWLSASKNATVPAGALVLLLVGGFVLCYGVRSFRNARFPFLLLLLIVPIPIVVLDRVVAALQAGSAEVSYLLFRVAGVPILRHGMVMSLPGVDIEVAPQCSGIRSSMALFIAGVVLSRVLLRTSWARILAILCVGPIAIFRNAARIFGISFLGVYVDRSFFFGDLHRHGGLPFSLVGFALLIPLLWLLRWAEQRLGSGQVGLVDSRLGNHGGVALVSLKVGGAGSLAAKTPYSVTTR
jgi:exosortase